MALPRGRPPKGTDLLLALESRAQNLPIWSTAELEHCRPVFCGSRSGATASALSLTAGSVRALEFDVELRCRKSGHWWEVRRGDAIAKAHGIGLAESPSEPSPDRRLLSGSLSCDGCSSEPVWRSGFRHVIRRMSLMKTLS